MDPQCEHFSAVSVTRLLKDRTASSATLRQLAAIFLKREWAEHVFLPNYNAVLLEWLLDRFSDPSPSMDLFRISSDPWTLFNLLDKTSIYDTQDTRIYDIALLIINKVDGVYEIGRVADACDIDGEGVNNINTCISGLMDFLSRPGLDPSFERSYSLLVRLISLHNYAEQWYSNIIYCCPEFYYALDRYIKQTSSKAQQLDLELNVARGFVSSIIGPFVQFCFLDPEDEVYSKSLVRLALIKLFVEIVFDPRNVLENMADIPEWFAKLTPLSTEPGDPLECTYACIFKSMLDFLPPDMLEKIYPLPISVASDLHMPGWTIACLQLAKRHGLEAPMRETETVMESFFDPSLRDDCQLSAILKGVLEVHPSIAFSNINRIAEKVAISTSSDLPVDTFRAFSEAYGAQRDLISYWKFVDAFVFELALTELETTFYEIIKANFQTYSLSQHEALLEKCVKELETPINYDDSDAPFTCARSLFSGMALVHLVDTTKHPLTKKQNDSIISMIKASMTMDHRIAESRVWQLRNCCLMLNDFPNQNATELEMVVPKIYKQACEIFTSGARDFGSDLYHSCQCIFRLLETGLLNDAEKYFDYLFPFLETYPPCTAEFLRPEIETTPESEYVGTYIPVNICRRWLHVAEKHLSPSKISAIFHSLIGHNHAGLTDNGILSCTISSNYFFELPQVTHCMFSCLLRFLKERSSEEEKIPENSTRVLVMLMHFPPSCLNISEKRLLLSRCLQAERNMAGILITEEDDSDGDHEGGELYDLWSSDKYINLISSLMERYLKEDVVVPDIISKESLFNFIVGYFPQIRYIRCDYPTVLGKCYGNLLNSKSPQEADEIALSVLEGLLSDYLQQIDTQDGEERRYTIGIVLISTAVILATTRLKNISQAIQILLRRSWTRVLNLICGIENSLSKSSKERSSFISAIFELLHRFDAFKNPPSVLDWKETCRFFNLELQAYSKDIMHLNEDRRTMSSLGCSLFIAKCYSVFVEFEGDESAIYQESELLIGWAIVLLTKVKDSRKDSNIMKETLNSLFSNLSSKYPDVFLRLYSKICSTATLGRGLTIDVLSVMSNNLDKKTMGADKVSKLLCEFIEFLYQCVPYEDQNSVLAEREQVHPSVDTSPRRYRLTEICKGLEMLEKIFTAKSWAITQYSLEMTISFISFANYHLKSREPHLSLNPDERVSRQAINKNMMTLLSTILFFHRHRFNGRYFLIVHAMQSLTDVVFSAAATDSSIKQNMDAAGSESGEQDIAEDKLITHVDGDTFAAEYDRLLTALCQPPSQSRKRKGGDSALVSAATAEKKVMARNVIPYVLLHFVKLMIQYPTIGGNLRKKLTNGIHAMFDCLSSGGSRLDQNIIRRTSSGSPGTSQELKMIYASMDSQSRPLFKSLYQDYEQFGKWRENIY